MSERLPLVLVVGGGELGSAVSHRLVRSGIAVVITDLAFPRCIRRNVCFAMVLVDGPMEVEGIRAQKALDFRQAEEHARRGTVAVLAGEFRRIAEELKPDILVDARMLKTVQDISSDLAPLVIGLGPGFTAGENADIVIETKRGHDLGRVIDTGRAHPDTGIPGPICGLTEERLIRAPASGTFRSAVELGAVVTKDDVVGRVGETEVKAPIGGLLRGLVADGVEVMQDRKMGDVDPRGSDIDPRTISDRGRAVGGGVLEAVMHWWAGRS
jgi:xanthine dehydrogenase accessory factor